MLHVTSDYWGKLLLSCC